MDSLTQIILGAAMGEVTIGKKVGNRALLWGAVGGTIPDLDVISGLFVSPIRELAMHRGFSHSIAFGILGGIGFGWLIHRMYSSRYHKYFATIGWLLIPFAVLFFISKIFEREMGLMTISIMSAIFGLMGWWLYRRYHKQPRSAPQASLRDWQWLMFWSVFTHPLLDCFTTYGTQLLLPFSDYRVAFNSISVADPIYTVPFLLCIIIASWLRRSDGLRRKLAWIGIGLSSMYLVFTVINKQRINKVWTDSLQAQGITYSRYMTSPTILNNVLWSCLADTPDGIVYGQYSLFDKEPVVKYELFERREDLLQAAEEDKTIKTLRWFSNDYFIVSSLGGDTLQVNDLRFGVSTSASGDQHFIFNFPVIKREDGWYEMLKTNGGPPPGEEQDMMTKLWARIKGE